MAVETKQAPVFDQIDHKLEPVQTLRDWTPEELEEKLNESEAARQEVLRTNGLDLRKTNLDPEDEEWLHGIPGAQEYFQCARGEAVFIGEIEAGPKE